MYDHPAVHSAPWEYVFPLPQLDVQGDFRTQTEGLFSRLTGVDGRYAGRLRRFPGFFEKYKSQFSGGDFPTTIGGTTYTLGSLNTTAPVLFKPFAVQYGNFVIRGIVFSAYGSDNKDRLFIVYSDENAAMQSAVLVAFGTDNTTGNKLTALDMAVDHQLLVITGEAAGNKVEKLARYTGSTNGWATADWDTTVPQISAAPTSRPGGPLTTNTSNIIKANTQYGIAWRIVYPDQGYVGPLTPVALIQSGSDPKSFFGQLLEIPIPTLNNGGVFTRAVMQIFRTPASTFIGTGGGDLFLESQQEIPRKTGSLSGTSTTAWTATTLTNNAAIPAGLAVGDAIYIAVARVPTSSANDPSGLTPADASYVGTPWGNVFLRTITNIAGTVITFSPSINTTYNRTDGSPGFNVTPPTANYILVWCASKNSGSDSTGSFTPFSNFVYEDGTGSVLQAATIGRSNYRRNNTGPAYFPVPDTALGQKDDALVLSYQVDPAEFGVFRKGNPRARFIEQYEDLLIRVTTDSPAEESSGIDIIRWDAPDKPLKGLCLVENRRKLEDLSSRVVGMVLANSFLAVVYDNGILRIHRSGSRLAVDPIENVHGTPGRYGFIAIGNNLYIASPLGILVCDLPSGQIEVMNATQQFFGESGRWGNDVASIQVAYDSLLGALFFLNPVQHEMLAIWMNQGVLTHFVDMPWDRVFSSPDFQIGGNRRAHFFLSGQGIFESDALYAQTYRTTCGNASGANLSWNGLANTGTNSTTLVPPAGKSFSADMIGHYIRFLDASTGAMKVRVKITGYSGGNLTFATAAPAPAAGDRFAVAGIPFQITCWPLYGDPQRPLLDMFRIKKTASMGAVYGLLSGDTGATNPNLVMRYQLFSRSRTTPVKEAEGVMDATDNRKTFQKLSCTQSVLVPGLENWSSNLDLELLGVLVSGSIEGTKQD